MLPTLPYSNYCIFTLTAVAPVLWSWRGLSLSARWPFPSLSPSSPQPISRQLGAMSTPPSVVVKCPPGGGDDVEYRHHPVGPLAPLPPSLHPDGRGRRWALVLNPVLRPDTAIAAGPQPVS